MLRGQCPACGTSFRRTRGFIVDAWSSSFWTIGTLLLFGSFLLLDPAGGQFSRGGALSYCLGYFLVAMFVAFLAGYWVLGPLVGLLIAAKLERDDAAAPSSHADEGREPSCSGERGRRAATRAVPQTVGAGSPGWDVPDGFEVPTESECGEEPQAQTIEGEDLLTEQPLEDWIDQLRTADVAGRCAAALALGEIGPEQQPVMDALVHAFLDEDKAVHVAAGIAIGFVKLAAPARHNLLHDLRHGDARVRGGVVQLLRITHGGAPRE
jgi:hypothetical protein